MTLSNLNYFLKDLSPNKVTLRLWYQQMNLRGGETQFRFILGFYYEYALKYSAIAVEVYFNTLFSYPWKCLLVRFPSFRQFNIWPHFPFRMVAKWSITSAMTNFIVTFIAKSLSSSSSWMIFQGYFTCSARKHSNVIFASNFIVAFSDMPA